MLRTSSVIFFVLSLLGLSCTNSDITSGSLESLDDLPVLQMKVDEIGPTTLDQLVDESTIIVQATLKTIDTGIGFSEGPNEDEPTAEYVELMGLNFAVKKVVKGDVPDDFTIPWYGFTRENVDGRPRSRIARIEIQDVNFKGSDLGSDFVLFLSGSGNKIDAYSITNSIISVDHAGELSAIATGSVVGRDGQTHTLEVVEDRVRFTKESDH